MVVGEDWHKSRTTVLISHRELEFIFSILRYIHLFWYIWNIAVDFSIKTEDLEIYPRVKNEFYL